MSIAEACRNQSALPAGQVVKLTLRSLISPARVMSIDAAEPRAGREGISNSAPTNSPVPSESQEPLPPLTRRSGERYSTSPSTVKRRSDAS